MVIFDLKKCLNLNDIGFESFCCLRPKVKRSLNLKPLLNAMRYALSASHKKYWEVIHDQP